MEKDLMEKLLNDFNGTLNEFNELVRKNDYDAVRRVLDEVNRLIQERDGIVLDDREPQYDHVLHELLDKMTGIVEKEITIEGIDGIKGSKYYTNDEVQRMIDEAEKELEEITRMVNTYKDVNDEAYAQARSDRSKIIARIADLKAALVPGQEFSTLTYTDPHLAELQEERAKLLAEKQANLEEIARLREEEKPAIPENSANQARVNEINARLAELENLFTDIEGQIKIGRGTKISQLIDNLRNNPSKNSELDLRLAELQEQLRLAGDRVKETRGFDEANAQARADYSSIVRQISDVEQQMKDSNVNDIAFLETLIPEVEETEAVLEPMDYTYMGRLSDEQIIRRLLSEQLHLSEEEIEATVGEYALVEVEDGAHDEYGEDNPISMRQLVRTRKVKEDITVEEAIATLEEQLYNETAVDHSQEISEINTRIEELDGIINDAQTKIEGIENQSIANLISRVMEDANRKPELEARLAELQEQLRAAGDRVRETRGFDEANAQANADYNAIVNEISTVEGQIKGIISLPAGLESITQEIAELEARHQEIQARLRAAGDRVRETRGFDEANAQARADYSAIVRENSEVESRINEINSLTVKGELENITQEITELEARRQELQEKLRAAGDRVRETRGFDEANAQARADYSAIVSEISDVGTRIAGLKERQDSIKDFTGIKKEEQRLNDANSEKTELNARKNELEQESKKQENPEVRKNIDKLKDIAGITLLEEQLQQYKDEYENLKQEKETLVPTPGKPGVDNSKRIAELEERNKEIDKRIAEIDKEIEGIPGAIPTRTTTKEILDVEKEAHIIGDHIFKTAAIRRELASRNITRDEFLEFYQSGLDKTNEQIEKLSQDYKKYIQEIGLILDNPENPKQRIDKQIIDAEKDGDTQLETKLLEQMRKNFIAVGREEQLKAVGLDHEITTSEDIQKMKTFYNEYKESVKTGTENIRASIAELKENAGIFAKEVERIKIEKATLELAGSSVAELESKAEERKQQRRDLLLASITPENELTDDQKELLDSWQRASERFLDKKTTAKYVYRDKDGVEKVLDVDSIDDTYSGYAKDVEFLGVPEYKENLEQVKAWEQTNDPYVFGKDVGEAYELAESKRPGAGEEVLKRIIADKQKYVETFNGIPNPHKVKYENWKTAGSTLKGMKPVSRDLPMQTRAKNGIENVFRFLGIRAPKYTRLDEDGNEVRDIKGGIATLAIDVAVVGGVAFTAATLGPGIVAAGYAAKGIVTVGNKIAEIVEYSRHKDEIDNNKPVINQANSDTREVARKEYYREQGDNRFVSWVKAKSDKYITRGREKETELAIVDKLVTEYSKEEDKRTDVLRENIEIANANQEARLRRQEQIAMGANTYNDIVRDPDAIDIDKATATIARNAALESVRQGRGREDVNSNSVVARKSQYVKEESPVDKTKDLDKDALNAKAEGQVSAVTAEQIYTGRKQKVDRMNKVLTMITAAGLKFGYTAWKDGFIKEDIIHHDAEYKDEIIHHEAETKNVEVPDYETRFDTSKTLEEIMKNNQGKELDGHYSVSGGIRGTQTRTIDGDQITAAWVDDKSAWGTGISDTQGLTAPVLTDRLAEAGLMDANGMLRQDITVQELLDSTGATVNDLTSLDGIYVNVGDNYWASLSDLMKGMTKEVQIGSHFETQVIPAWDETVQTLVKDAWDESVKTFDSGLAIDVLKDGAIIGAGMAIADQMHESVQTTYIDGTTPGRPKEVTPEAADTFDMIADKLFEQAKKEQKLNGQQEQGQQEKGNER